MRHEKEPERGLKLWKLQTVEALCSCVPLKTIQKNDNRTADDPRCRRSGSESGGRRKGEEEEQPQQEQPQQEMRDER